MRTQRPVALKELNPLITCPLCSGYLVDATKLLDCMHTFCRSCVVKHFENSKLCPLKDCLQPCKEKRPDMILQTLVYKIVPGLYSKEIQRRDDFYRSTDARASSSCSDDSLFGENTHEQEEWIHNLGLEFLSPDDSVSLSLEYYQRELDSTPLEKNGKLQSYVIESKSNNSKSDRRYLQCPAAVQMTHLQKFIRMKFGLKDDHKVDIIYGGEVLPTFFTLMDVAYTFKWNRAKPLRFFYRIFSRAKIRPIKIINTSSGGERHHQIVAVSTTTASGPSKDEVAREEKEARDCRLVLSSLEDEQRNKDKERLMNELKLQVRKRPVAGEEKEEASRKQSSHHHHHHQPQQENNIFRYGEDNNKEKFAETRDREWKLLRNPDEEYKVSKKRKKNKHSKDEHKKRKLHAEITSEESLKLKVKLTPHNGHKHKHHKNVAVEQTQPVSSKEKISQLRQVRHKNISCEEKAKTTPLEVEKPNFLNKETTIETKVEPKKNPPVKNIQYPPGFTVSRIDNQVGVKRNRDSDSDGGGENSKKPSLEITLITPQSSNPLRRPPPATIPLQKIKNSLNFNSGVSIIPKIPEKIPEKSDTVPLDLSKPHNNGFKSQGVTPDRSANLSNLQMLSKVASEHAQSINKGVALPQKGPKPQIPNLQSIRLLFNSEKKSMPKLNEINKNDFLQGRIMGNSRITRPNQNQCIRNIPNPSLLVRQQNQNRLNCLMQVNNGGGNNNSNVNNNNINANNSSNNPAGVSNSTSNFVNPEIKDNKNSSLQGGNKEATKNVSSQQQTNHSNVNPSGVSINLNIKKEVGEQKSNCLIKNKNTPLEM